MNVLHLIPSLGSGGAERMLLRIINSDLKNNHIIVIIKSMDNNSVFYKIDRKNVKFYSLDYESIKDTYVSVKLYLKYLDEHSPKVIQTWMYHANIMGGFLAYIKGHRNIFWNIRSAEFSFSMKKRTMIFMMFGALLSYFVPKKIISCSNRAISVHQKLLYKKNIFSYIPNGIQENYLLNCKVLHNKTPVIGFVARLDTQKNHYRFLKSLEYLNMPIELVLIGRGVNTLDLSEFCIEQHNISMHGEVENVFEFYDSFDFLVLPSIYGEAFPNVLIESMSRGVVCIASDVGDSWSIISSSGYRISNPRSAKSIVDALEYAVSGFYEHREDYLNRSERAISIVRQKYSLSGVISKYNQVWTS